MSTTPELGNTTSASFPSQQVEKVTKNLKKKVFEGVHKAIGGVVVQKHCS